MIPSGFSQDSSGLGNIEKYEVGSIYSGVTGLGSRLLHALRILGVGGKVSANQALPNFVDAMLILRSLRAQTYCRSISFVFVRCVRHLGNFLSRFASFVSGFAEPQNLSLSWRSQNVFIFRPDLAANLLFLSHNRHQLSTYRHRVSATTFFSTSAASQTSHSFVMEPLDLLRDSAATLLPCIESMRTA